jgi:hypothetical protein
MKRYKLLKNLPFAKAGAIFKQWTRERSGKEEKVLVNANNLTTTLWAGDIEAFDEWFEEVKTPSEYYLITDDGFVDFVLSDNHKTTMRRKAIGNCFETKEEAEKYLEYLKAKAIIKEDTKGFKPDWNNLEQIRFYGRWDFQFKIPFRGTSFTQKDTTIYFKTVEDIEESFEKHPKEWKIYLTYEG